MRRKRPAVRDSYTFGAAVIKALVSEFDGLAESERGYLLKYLREQSANEAWLRAIVEKALR